MIAFVFPGLFYVWLFGFACCVDEPSFRRIPAPVLAWIALLWPIGVPLLLLVRRVRS